MSGAGDREVGGDRRLVVALGGNALGDTPEEQLDRVRAAAPALLGLIDDRTEIIITHGNGPQVGMIQKAFGISSVKEPRVPAMDLPECGAMSQGYIGYHLQQALGAEMHRTGRRWHVASVVTQIEVDADDPSFLNPTKPIGAFLTQEQAEELAAQDPTFSFAEDSGRGYRRVVASPRPRRIVESESILNLLDNDFIVVACGGGGIPVVRDAGGDYRGVAAVIDKDMAAALLGEDCDADTLVLLTAIERVALNFGGPDQRFLSEMTVDEARRYADEGQFGKGSMEPKVRAAISFCEGRPDRVAIIGALERAADAVRGVSGTRIHC